MKIIKDLHDFPHQTNPVTLAAGFFDGVHLGHRSILDRAIESARKHGGEAWVLTFDTHPQKILRPDSAPLMLTSNKHKLALLEDCGIDGCIMLPFSSEVANMPPEVFADWLFHCVPTLSEIVIGENWRFGAKAAGTPELLQNLGRMASLTVTALPPVLDEGQTVSSTRIRTAILHGELDHARAMLGRHVSVLGTVIHGRAIGRKLGYPSANIDPHNEALPPLGVYAVRATAAGKLYNGVLNFGTRPTFDKDKSVPPVLELHLFDFSGDLYDQDVEAHFVARLRDEWYFSTIDELIVQIKKDVEDATKILENQA